MPRAPKTKWIRLFFRISGEISPNISSTFEPEIDNDALRSARRTYREEWISGLPAAFESERKLDYGRPMMRLGSEEKL